MAQALRCSIFPPQSCGDKVGVAGVQSGPLPDSHALRAGISRAHSPCCIRGRAPARSGVHNANSCLSTSGSLAVFPRARLPAFSPPGNFLPCVYRQPPPARTPPTRGKSNPGGLSLPAMRIPRRLRPPPPGFAQRGQLPRMTVVHRIVAAQAQAHEIPQRPLKLRPILHRPRMMRSLGGNMPPIPGALAAHVTVPPKRPRPQFFPSCHGNKKKPKPHAFARAQAQRLRRKIFASRSTRHIVPHFLHFTGSASIFVLSSKNKSVLPQGQTARPSLGLIIAHSRSFCNLSVIFSRALSKDIHSPKLKK